MVSVHLWNGSEWLLTVQTAVNYHIWINEMITAKLTKLTRNSLMSDVCCVGYMLGHRWSSMSSIINTVLFLLFLKLSWQHVPHAQQPLASSLAPGEQMEI